MTPLESYRAELAHARKTIQSLMSNVSHDKLTDADENLYTLLNWKDTLMKHLVQFTSVTESAQRRGRGRPRKDGSTVYEEPEAITYQLRKVINLNVPRPVTFLDRTVHEITPAQARAYMDLYNGLTKPYEREHFQAAAWQSYEAFLDAIYD